MKSYKPNPSFLEGLVNILRCTCADRLRLFDLDRNPIGDIVCKESTNLAFVELMDDEHEEESKSYTSQLEGESTTRKLRVPHTEAGLDVFAHYYKIRYECRLKGIFEEREDIINQTIQTSYDSHKMMWI